MESLSNIQKSILLGTSLLFLVWVGFLSINILKKTDSGSVLQQEDLNVSANIFGCYLDLTVKPEKRIPAVNNWSAPVTVELYTTANTFIDSFATTTNSFGQASVDICSEGIYLDGTQNYTFYIRGESTLKKEFPNLPAFGFVSTSIDFSSSNIRLMNGETSNVYNNKINTLDISTQITRIGTVNQKNDLNRDGMVNVLDISNTITNFGLTGDCSPQDIINGSCI